LARAFVAKAVYNDLTTVAFLERLRTDRNLCRICGWDHAGKVPSERKLVAGTGSPSAYPPALIPANHVPEEGSR
jgi:hypothetical protein